MHIPSTMLNGQVCPVTLAVGAAGLAVAARWARHSTNRPSAHRFAAVASLIFALQMLNYPVQDGTSGHLVGAMLGVSLLSVPFAILAMAMVLFVQAVFFGDGGVNALGANIINMAFLGAGVAGLVYEKAIKNKINKNIVLFGLSWFSVVLGALACSLQVAWSGAVSFFKVLPAMVGVHALIGAGEGILTVVVVGLLSANTRFWRANEKMFVWSAFSLAVVAAMLSPFASSFPDGLEWVCEKLSFAQFSGMNIPVAFPDYQASFITPSAMATIVAGLIGAGIVFALTLAAGEMLARRSPLR